MSRTPIRAGLAVGVLTGAMLLAGCHGGSQPQTAGTAPTATPPTTSPTTAPTVSPAADVRPAATIPGALFYDILDSGDNEKLVKLRGARTQTVLTGYGAYTAEVSPDGRRIAYVTNAARLIVANADGSGARTLRSGVLTAGFGPTWSSDGGTLLIGLDGGSGKAQIGTLRVADKKFTPLSKRIQGIHPRFTGDGKRVFYSDGRCAILSANVDGTGVKQVPVLGLDSNSSANPRRLRACDIVSLNRDGSRMTVDLHKGNDTDGDIGGSTVANAVIDTATGKVVALPVRGTVTAVLYRPDGTLLVRTVSAGKRTLTLFTTNLSVLARMAEPAAVKAYNLRDYTG
jgi:TolB protein